MATKKKLTNMISIRLSSEDSALLDEVAKIIPMIPKLALARTALCIGLEEIRKNPLIRLGARMGKKKKTP